jgi:hypothetical protein
VKSPGNIISSLRVFNVSAGFGISKTGVIRRLESTEVPYLRMRFEDIFYAENPEQAFDEIADFFVCRG